MLMKNYMRFEHNNVGSGIVVSIIDLVNVNVEVVGYESKIVWDNSKPDGTPRKLMDTSYL